MNELQLIVYFINTGVLLAVIYAFGHYTSKILFPTKKVEAHLNTIIGFLFIIAFSDFIVGAIVPFNNGDPNYLLYLLGGFIVSVLIIPIFFALQSVYPFDIANKNKVKTVINITTTLVIVSQILATIVYSYEILAYVFDISDLIGFNEIFLPDSTFLLTDIPSSDTDLPLLFTIFIIRSLLIITHHFSIIVGFLSAFLIFNEWGVAMKDPIIGFFKLFAFGYLFQGIGQVIKGISLIGYSAGLYGDAIKGPIDFTSGTLAISGTVIYYIAFSIACLNLLSNIEHLVFPRWLIKTLKLSSVLIPVFYAFLYSLILIGSIVGYTVLYDAYYLVDSVIQITHLTDFIGIWLVPLAAAMFFLAAYVRSKEKPNVKFSSYLVLGFFSVLLLLYPGNNTLTLISWTGLIHGQIGIIGILFFMYSLSRVAEHASRHRQVIRKIRENPDDFMFLNELGKSERKLQAWAKIDMMTKDGLIKPLTPAVEKKDETQIAFEVNSYMAELEAIQKRRAAKRTARQAIT